MTATTHVASTYFSVHYKQSTVSEGAIMLCSFSDLEAFFNPLVKKLRKKKLKKKEK